jgi:hypothetical protein
MSEAYQMTQSEVGDCKDFCFRIHGLTHILMESSTEVELGRENGISNPFTCMGEVLLEAAEGILKIIDKMEANHDR